MSHDRTERIRRHVTLPDGDVLCAYQLYIMTLKANLCGASLFALIVPACGLGWHQPHVQITRAAVLSLPPAMQQRLQPEARNLIEIYCWYPDRYGNADRLERAVLRTYCEKPDGQEIHNITWQRREDLASLEHLLKGMANSLREGKTVTAAQYAGVLAHLLEDSTSPAHCPVPLDEKFIYLRDLLPPPPSKEKIELHPALEIAAPEFDLGKRAPQIAGRSIQEAATSLLDRCYAIVRDNRAHLIEMVQAVYTDDVATLNRFRLKAEVAGAELLADAYYTAFVLAGDALPRSSAQKASEENRKAPWSSCTGPRTRLQWPGIEVWVGHALQRQHREKNAPEVWSATQRQAALNLEFGVREVVQSLGLDAAVNSHGPGQFIVRAFASDELTGMKNFPPNFQLVLGWPPYIGAEAPRFYIDGQGLLTECIVVADGMPQMGSIPIKKQQILRTNDYHGDPLYETQMTTEGGLSIRKVGGGECSLKPAGSGFAEGAVLVCTGKGAIQVNASDDVVRRRLHVTVGNQPPEVHPYDPDTQCWADPRTVDQKAWVAPPVNDPRRP